MTLRDDFLAGADDLVATFGVAGTLVYPSAVYNLNGTVTETPVSVPVTVAGPMDESRRYAATGADSRVTGTFYISASDLTTRPTTGHRIVVGTRTWFIVATVSTSCNGLDVIYQCDCGEVA